MIYLDTILVPPNRQRRIFDEAKMQDLKDSIIRAGLIHPIIVREVEGGFVLVAGERRKRAIEMAQQLDESFTCAGTKVPSGKYPCLSIGDLSEEDAYEAELEENIRRVDLSWQEQASATARLMDLRSRQAAAAGRDVPSAADIASEVRGSSAGSNQDAIRTDLIVARHLDDPDVQSAKTPKEALKVLKIKEERKRNEALGESVGRTFSKENHTLYQGDCLTLMKGLKDDRFDCILTDPPYGMGADEFGDSGGRVGSQHFYDDSYTTWVSLIHDLAVETYRIAKPQAHAYVFCDFERFAELKATMAGAGWNVFRTPIIWHNPTSMRAPWPDQGPQRKWQACLYATKGKRPCLRLAPDLVTFPSDENIGHPAQKAVGLYKDLLTRTCRPGDSVIDPFCGSGTIFPAAHDLKLNATGIEMDAGSYGLAAKRLGELL